MIFNIPGHIEMIRNGTKTQTRRLNRGIYQVGKDYAVQRKRGVKAEQDIRIVMDRIWEETQKYCGGYYYEFCISEKDAWAEGGYTREDYERLFRELNPKWRGGSRWAFKFHVIEVQKRLNINITAMDYTDICLHCKQKLKTDKEKKQDYCEKCWAKYTEEMDAIYGGVDKKRK